MPANLNFSQRSVQIPPAGIEGDLAVPPDARGIVIFAHGSGSSRFSSRNRFVARVLQETGFSTLLLDLLTAKEEQVDIRTRELRFDIGLLAERLVEATRWFFTERTTAEFPVGYFGASTGAAAALIAAAELPESTRAVVSRGGRPDLAGASLRKVRAPVLLIVGGDDHQVIDLNRRAMAEFQSAKKMEIVPGATHLFEEPGALDEVAKLATDWFSQHLATKLAAGR